MVDELRELVMAIGLNRSRATTLSLAGGGLPESPLEILPDDFLERAEDDYEQGGTAGQLNAITNAKRAVEAQVDEALLRFGYRIKRWSWTRRLETFSRMGLVAPRILRRIRSSRNALEHDHKIPSDQEIEEALDLASLFVAASQRYLSFFFDEFSMGNRDEQVHPRHFERELLFTMSTSGLRPAFVIWGYTDVRPDPNLQARTEVGNATIDATYEIFPTVVRLANATERQFRLERAVEQFFTELGIP